MKENAADRKAEDEESVDEIQNEILRLQGRLERAKGRLQSRTTTTTTACNQDDGRRHHHHTLQPLTPSMSDISATHFFLLLSDSALPLGSFAFSSGLESYLAHTRGTASFSSSSSSSFSPSSFEASFLPLSVSSYASTTLPFVLAAHRDPAAGAVARLDDALDAAVVCAVGRRASVAQGRALLGIWERSLSRSGGLGARAGAEAREEALRPFSALLRSASSSSSASALAPTSSSSSRGGSGVADDDGAEPMPPATSAHLAPLFGAVASLSGLSLRQAAYVFVLSHVKALISAAVRASLFGPYQAQRILASGRVQELIAGVVDREWDTPVEEAGQSVPVMDLWIGRHEMLYSRIFNS